VIAFKHAGSKNWPVASSSTIAVDRAQKSPRRFVKRNTLVDVAGMRKESFAWRARQDENNSLKVLRMALAMFRLRNNIDPSGGRLATAFPAEFSQIDEDDS